MEKKILNVTKSNVPNNLFVCCDFTNRFGKLVWFTRKDEYGLRAIFLSNDEKRHIACLRIKKQV